MSDPMHWEDASRATVDKDAYYLVQHNGREWRDFDLAVMSGTLVLHRLRPEYVRGRPEWIAKIVRPPATGANCGQLPIVREREEACTEPFSWVDGVPYCNTCGLYRNSKHRDAQPTSLRGEK